MIVKCPLFSVDCYSSKRSGIGYGNIFSTLKTRYMRSSWEQTGTFRSSAFGAYYVSMAFKNRNPMGQK